MILAKDRKNLGKKKVILYEPMLSLVNDIINNKEQITIINLLIYLNSLT